MYFAFQLYKTVAERGRWSEKLMEAHKMYKEGNINEALLMYAFLGELGYEVAQSNVAYIMDMDEASAYPKNETFQRALLYWTRAASQGVAVSSGFGWKTNAVHLHIQ